MPRIIASLAVYLLLSACAFSTPFSGPGYGPAGPPDSVVVGITHITLKDDGALRDKFWDYVAEVDQQLEAAPGFIKGSKRRELLGDEAWTATVWRDGKSLAAFISSGAHKRAMKGAYDTFDDARFARLTLDREAFQENWDNILAMLEANARAYYE
ncbi:MAG: hypothetical protein NXI16_11650 [Alphaproteobacteria bacterium]|nr:hypothetical protein [Alphaproteobacteria bacterium]